MSNVWNRAADSFAEIGYDTSLPHELIMHAVPEIFNMDYLIRQRCFVSCGKLFQKISGSEESLWCLVISLNLTSRRRISLCVN